MTDQAQPYQFPPPGTVPERPVAAQPQPPQQPKGSPVFSVVLVLLLVLGGVGAYFGIQYLNRYDVDHAAVGDCVRDNDSDDVPYKLAECGDAAAKYEVFGVLKTGADKSCRQVAGATRAFDNEDGYVCIGPKGADPQKSINIAVEGDCLAMTGEQPQRLECGDPQAEYKILKRLENVATFKVARICEDVAGAEKTYSYNWKSSGGPDLSGVTTQVVMCLGKK